MMDLYKKIAQHSVVRYIFIGGTSYIIEIAVLYILADIVGLGPTLGVALSFWIGLIISFFLQKLFAFRNKSFKKKLLLKQAVAYGALIVVNYIFTLAFVIVFEPIIGLIIARTVALIITTVWNFLLYSRVIFKQPIEE